MSKPATSGSGRSFLHLVEQERLAAADVENPGAVLQPVDVDQRLATGAQRPSIYR